MIENKLLDLKSVEKYSFSKLNCMADDGCPYSYYLTYIKKLPSRLSNGFADVGTLMHSILEDFTEGKIFSFELLDALESRWDEAVPYGVKLKFSEDFTKDMTEKYYQQCADYLKTFNGFPSYKVVSSEEEFNLLACFEGEDIILRGFIDLILEDESGELIIADHKSKAEFKTAEELHKYTRQLYMYAIHVKNKYGKYPKELWFNQFRANHIEKIKFDFAQYEETIRWIEDSIRRIKAESLWLANPDYFFCNNLCSHRNHCEEKA